MQRTAESGDGLFHNSDPGNGGLGTLLDEKWLNAVQEELAGILEAAGIALDPGDDDQLAWLANFVRRGAAPPVAGTYPVGALVWNTAAGQRPLGWVCTAAGTPGTWRPFPFGGAPDYVCVADQKAAGTDGGTFTSGAWQTRDLNTVVADAGELAALAGNELTLPAGTYRVSISAPAYGVNDHQARLYDVTAGAVLLYGTSENTSAAGAAVDVQTRSEIRGVITLAAAHVLRVEHRAKDTNATDGFGSAVNWDGPETYTVAEFTRL